MGVLSALRQNSSPTGAVASLRDWLAWREQNQINWTMWGVIAGFVVGIVAMCRPAA